MASDLSSGCTEAIEVLDEKEEGEISLEDVSSSEEGHLNYGYGTRVAQCSNCSSTQHNAAWCTVPAKLYHSRGPNRRDAVQGKENRHQIKESGCIGAKHSVSTLQEKNDDLVPISSDSDMEIVGLADNSKQIVIHSSSKSRVKKRKKKKRNHASLLTVDDLVSSATVDASLTECVGTLMHDIKISSSRSYHREISPTHRTNRARVASRSPPRRHRSVIQQHSPFRRSKSIIHARSTMMKRSPRRLKSPKRSPSYRSPTEKQTRKTSYLDVMPSSHNYIDTHKLLKKVRHLDSIGTESRDETLYKDKQHASSLKEKLSHMMKGACDNNSDITGVSKEKSNARMCEIELNDADDEEDLALLRQKALETQQKKSNKQNEQLVTETVKKISIGDDQDEEDLELRMIALRSAVLKKHQNRLQKGMKSGKYKKCNTSRSESPFTQSFLDSIPIPGEELLSIASPPHTPIPMIENNHTEDMDLDTDVEREKEKLPYSPTDKITANITIDTELLGIQPSDVSFINLNNATNSTNFNAVMSPSQDEQKSYQGKIIENRSYLPNVAYYTPPQNAFYVSPNSSMQYSPVDLAESVRPDYMKVHDPRMSILNSTSNYESSLSQERPYSPTDAPIYDPDLSQTFPQALEPIATLNSSLTLLGSPYYMLNSHENNEQCNRNHTQITEDNLDAMETLSTQPNVDSATTSQQGSVSPSSSMVTIDDLPETDVDMTCSDKTVKSAEYITGGAVDNIKEPLYMKGIPDVTKDVNKIPTLINRTLVPASILKTNKQLQQPLHTKKPAPSQEPTFKSAEMQPVDLPEDTRTNSSFKPIKLMSFPQKTHNVLMIPTAFHDSMQEDPTNEQPSTNEDGSLPVNSNNIISVQSNVNAECPDKACDIKSHKKTKRGGKKKGSGTAQSKTGTNNDNIDILDKQLSEATELMTRKDKENHTDVSNLDVPRDNVLGSEISLKTDESELKDKEALSSNTIEQVQDTNRRQSLDEDEEALRAILLASLPKRVKTNSQSHSNSILNVSASSDCTNQITAVQIAPVIAVTETNANSTTSSSPVKSYGSENDRNQSNSTEKSIIAVTAQEGLSVGVVKAAPLLNSGRKRLVPMTKGPQKKHIKRIPISASTKVVNNAKKYQNAMIQKKLNVQKAALYSKQKITENKVATKVQANDTKWSTTTKTVSDTQRIVINLESDTESDSESEQRAKTVKTMDKQPTVNPTAEFEKNLDQFLRAVRKKQESMAAARPTPLSQTSKKDITLKMKLENSSNLHTPLAVRHLPASQQEEYRRLKQQILEREKLKLHRTVETNSLKNKTTEAISKPVPSHSPGRESNSKINQITSAKSTDLNTQQLNKENCSKNLDSIKNTSNNKAIEVDRQEITSPSQTKTMMNENSSNNVANEIISPSQPVSIETQNEVAPKPGLLQGLKVLSTVEVNRKFGQIQLKNDTNEQVVKINNEVTLNNNKTVIKRNEDVFGSKEAVDDQYTNQLIQSVEKEIVANNNIAQNNDSMDSNATTVILNSQNTEREINVDTSDVSTIRLSQLEGSSRLSISSTKCKDEDLPLFKSNLLSNDKKSIVENWETIKRDVKTKLDTLITLPRAQQEQHLTDTEQKLVLKRYTILDDLAEMSGSLRQWHMERDLQTNLVAEVKKLREQLRVAEERLQLQRNRINSIGPKVVAAHGKINAGRQECFKLTTICTSLGSRIIGKEYKVPEAGAQLLDNRLKEVANHTRQLSRKKVPSIILAEAYELTKSDDSLSTVNSDVSQTDDLLEVHCGVDILNNIDNSASTILNASECSMRENETGDNVLKEKTVIDIKETDVKEIYDQEEQNVAVNDSSISNNIESVPQQSNTEKEEREETIVHQPESSSVPVAISNITFPKDSEESNQKGSSEDPTVRPESTGESSSHDKTSAKSEADCPVKKTIVPYESILVHFKVPRNTNPNGVLCPYELMGTCNDGECQFVHQRENQAK
ncbi:uncharacterized protein LOC143258947 isoform X2 [Megalopta genalis]|uniref:uncharacterized protein LOC143258947 isoform X2 n=1 Tax=Megalopta genalis TaxID=115081 RepID=UPI003FD11865